MGRELTAEEFGELERLLHLPFPPFGDFKGFLQRVLRDYSGLIEAIELKGSTVFKLLNRSQDFSDLDIVIHPRANCGYCYEQILNEVCKAIENRPEIKFSALCIGVEESDEPRYLMRIKHPSQLKCDLQVASTSGQSHTCTFDEPLIDITSLIIGSDQNNARIESRHFPLDDCQRAWEEGRFLPFVPQGDGLDGERLSAYFKRSQRSFFRFARLIGAKGCVIGMDGLCEGFWKRWNEENETNSLAAWKHDLKQALNEVGGDPSKVMGLLLFLMHNFPLSDQMVEVIHENWPLGRGPISGLLGGARSVGEFRRKIDLLALRCLASEHFVVYEGFTTTCLSNEHGMARYLVEWGEERVILNLSESEKNYARKLFNSSDLASAQTGHLLNTTISQGVQNELVANLNGEASANDARQSVQEALKARAFDMGIINLLNAADVDEEWMAANRSTLRGILEEFYADKKCGRERGVAFKNRYLSELYASVACDYFRKLECGDFAGEIGSLKQLHKGATEAQKETIGDIFKEQLCKAIASMSPEELLAFIDQSKSFCTKTIISDIVEIALQRFLDSEDETQREGLLNALTRLATLPFTAKKGQSTSQLTVTLKNFLLDQMPEKTLKALPPAFLSSIIAEEACSEKLKKCLERDLADGKIESVRAIFPKIMEVPHVLKILSPEMLETLLFDDKYGKDFQGAFIEKLQESAFAETLLSSMCKKQTARLLAFALKHYTYSYSSLNAVKNGLKNHELLQLIDASLKQPRYSSKKFFDLIAKEPNAAYKMWTTSSAQLRSDPNYLEHLPVLIAKLLQKRDDNSLKSFLEAEFSYFKNQRIRLKILQEVFRLAPPRAEKMEIWLSLYHTHFKKSSQFEVMALLFSHFATVNPPAIWKGIGDGLNEICDRAMIKKIGAFLIEAAFEHLSSEIDSKDRFAIGNVLQIISSHCPQMVIRSLQSQLSKESACFLKSLKVLLFQTHSHLCKEQTLWLNSLDQLESDVRKRMDGEGAGYLVELYLFVLKLKNNSRKLTETETQNLFKTLLKLDKAPQLIATVNLNALDLFRDQLIPLFEGVNIQSPSLRQFIKQQRILGSVGKPEYTALLKKCISEDKTHAGELKSDALLKLLFEGEKFSPAYREVVASITAPEERYLACCIGLRLVREKRVRDLSDLFWLAETATEAVSHIQHRSKVKSPLVETKYGSVSLQWHISQLYNLVTLGIVGHSECGQFDAKQIAIVISVLKQSLNMLNSLDGAKDPRSLDLLGLIFSVVGMRDSVDAVFAGIIDELATFFETCSDFSLVRKLVQLFGTIPSHSAMRKILREPLLKALYNGLRSSSREVPLDDLIGFLVQQKPLLTPLPKTFTNRIVALLDARWDEIASSGNQLNLSLSLMKSDDKQVHLFNVDASNLDEFYRTRLIKNIAQAVIDENFRTDPSLRQRLQERCFQTLEELDARNQKSGKRSPKVVDLLFTLNLAMRGQKRSRLEKLDSALLRGNPSKGSASDRIHHLSWSIKWMIAAAGYTEKPFSEKAKARLKKIEEVIRDLEQSEEDRCVLNMICEGLRQTPWTMSSLKDFHSKLRENSEVILKADPLVLELLKDLSTEMIALLIKNHKGEIYPIWSSLLELFPENQKPLIDHAADCVVNLGCQHTEEAYLANLDQPFFIHLLRHYPTEAQRSLRKIRIYWELRLGRQRAESLDQKVTEKLKGVSPSFESKEPAPFSKPSPSASQTHSLEVMDKAALLERFSSPEEESVNLFAEITSALRLTEKSSSQLHGNLLEIFSIIYRLIVKTPPESGVLSKSDQRLYYFAAMLVVHTCISTIFKHSFQNIINENITPWKEILEKLLSMGHQLEKEGVLNGLTDEEKRISRALEDVFKWIAYL